MITISIPPLHSVGTSDKTSPHGVCYLCHFALLALIADFLFVKFNQNPCVTCQIFLVDLIEISISCAREAEREIPLSFEVLYFVGKSYVCYRLYMMSYSTLKTFLHMQWLTNPSILLLWQSVGADVNLRLFRGFATAAAAREGHHEILEILIKAGASQPACEEALLEASSHGYSHLAKLLMGSDLIRPQVAVHGLVTACCRGFVDVVDILLKV